MGSMVSAEFFEVLGVRPAAGRLLDRRDAAPDAPAVIVISYALWQRRFGGDPGIVGSTLSFDTPATIVGVAAPGFEYPARVEMWFPLQLTPDVVATREYQPFSILARLRPGASIESVRRDAVAYVRQTDALESPAQARGLRSVVLPFEEAVLGDVRPSIEILCGAVLVLLLTAWSNVANLLLMRGAARSGEIALRSALGADRGDLLRPLLAEAALLAVGGAVLAVPVADWTVAGLIAIRPTRDPAPRGSRTRFLDAGHGRRIGGADNGSGRARTGGMVRPAARRPPWVGGSRPGSGTSRSRRPFSAGGVSGRTRPTAHRRGGGACGKSAATSPGRHGVRG